MSAGPPTAPARDLSTWLGEVFALSEEQRVAVDSITAAPAHLDATANAVTCTGAPGCACPVCAAAPVLSLATLPRCYHARADRPGLGCGQHVGHYGDVHDATIDLTAEIPAAEIASRARPVSMLDCDEPPLLLAGDDEDAAILAACRALGERYTPQPGALPSGDVAELLADAALPAHESPRDRVRRLMREGCEREFTGSIRVDAPNVPQALLVEGLRFMREALGRIVDGMGADEIARTERATDEQIREEAAAVARGAMLPMRPS